MNNTLLQVKIKQRLNKLSSYDYDNIEPWQVVEAFNKVQLEWVRDQLGGSNTRKEGDEQSKRRIDDLQILLTTIPMQGTSTTSFYESTPLPANYLEFKRVNATATHCDCTDPRSIKVDLAEEANAEHYLRDPHTSPSWEWAESFCTLQANRCRIYTLQRFDITGATLTYYRLPRHLLIAGVTDPSTGELSSADVTCEFKDDITELLVDLTASQLAGDLENFQQLMRTKQQAESHN